jgi:hypothetical protein
MKAAVGSGSPESSALPIMENIWRLTVGGLAAATNTSTGCAVLRQLDAETGLLPDYASMTSVRRMSGPPCPPNSTALDQPSTELALAAIILE